MKIAIIGASGNAGIRLVREAQTRGHEFTAVTRSPDNYTPLAGERAVSGNVQDVDSLAAALAGHDAVFSSVTFVETEPSKLIEGVRRSGVSRYLLIGGAGSLYAACGNLFIDTPDFPAFVLEESRAGKRLLEALREVDDLDWTMIAPSAYFEAGKRTGTFRVGVDHLLYAEDGRSSISYEDLAVAMVDELEKPTAIKKRITVGY